MQEGPHCGNVMLCVVVGVEVKVVILMWLLAWRLKTPNPKISGSNPWVDFCCMFPIFLSAHSL